MENPILPDKFLLEEADGLPSRPSRPHSLYKLKALSTYIQIANTAMRNQNWRARYFVDLQAGPGKNRIGSKIVFGSPLIALTTEHSFTHYRFNEINLESKHALEQRVNVSNLRQRVQISQGDANEIVKQVCEEIEAKDEDRSYGSSWSTFNIAFLDPEGLELHWETIEHLARIRKMDLIINFSTSGLIRTSGAQVFDAGDRFFGTSDWRKVFDPWDKHSTKRRKLIEFYLSRLNQFGYNIDTNPERYGIDLPVRNSRNAEIYTLIFASKSKLGEKFWKQAVKSTKPQSELPGFE